MLATIDDIEFKGYSICASAKKHGIAASNIQYWINGLTNTKRRGPVTVMTEEEEDEVVEWCKEMAQLGHGLELILKSIVAQIFQGRPSDPGGLNKYRYKYKAQKSKCSKIFRTKFKL